MKARTRLITLIIMAVAAVALIGWDIYAAANSVEGDTISELTLEYTQDRQGVVYGVLWGLGLLCGHLFWPQWRDRK